MKTQKISTGAAISTRLLSAHSPLIASAAKTKEIADREAAVQRREDAIKDVRSQLADAKLAKLAAEEREATLSFKLRDARRDMGIANEAKHKIELAMLTLLAEKSVLEERAAQADQAADAGVAAEAASEKADHDEAQAPQDMAEEPVQA